MPGSVELLDARPWLATLASASFRSARRSRRGIGTASKAHAAFVRNGSPPGKRRKPQDAAKSEPETTGVKIRAAARVDLCGNQNFTVRS